MKRVLALVNFPQHDRYCYGGKEMVVGHRKNGMNELKWRWETRLDQGGVYACKTERSIIIGCSVVKAISSIFSCGGFHTVNSNRIKILNQTHTFLGCYKDRMTESYIY